LTARLPPTLEAPRTVLKLLPSDALAVPVVVRATAPVNALEVLARVMAFDPELKLEVPVTVRRPVCAMAPPVVVMLNPPAPMVSAGSELMVELLALSALSVTAPPSEIAAVPALNVRP
jgi:hypothetical protein